MKGMWPTKDMRSSPQVLPKYNLLLIKIVDRVLSAGELHRAELKQKGITLEKGVSFRGDSNTYGVSKRISGKSVGFGTYKTVDLANAAARTVNLKYGELKDTINEDNCTSVVKIIRDAVKSR